MIPLIEKREQLEQTTNQQASFGISTNDQAHVMRILRDQLYSDRVLAVLREYTSNAWDANKTAGRGNVPIEVTLPTESDLFLTIKDCGSGLSKNDVFNVYTQYGASTKRGSNDSVGMLGIGSKSGFAYSQSFTVTSYFGGFKSTYNAALDASDIGVMQLIHEEPCDVNTTGIEIKIPVKKEDINAFYSTAEMLFEFFEPKPKINIAFNKKENQLLKYKNGYVRLNRTYKSIAVVGCIPYKISHNELVSITGKTILQDHAELILLFDIGDIEFSANREELKYTQKTRDKMSEKIALLFSEIDADINAMLQNSQLTDWQKRLKLQEFSEAGIRVKTYLQNWGIATSFYINLKTAEPSCMLINNSTMPLIIRDTRKAAKGFEVPSSIRSYRKNAITTLLTPVKGCSITDVITEVESQLKFHKASGLPIKLLSEFKWVKPPSAPRRTSKAFEYVFDYWDKKTKNWLMIENHQESKNDVYVLLDAYNEILDNKSALFYNNVYRDKNIASVLKISFPKIIGHKIRKSSKKKTFLGQSYFDWRDKFYKNLTLNFEYIQQLELKEWEKIFGFRNNTTQLNIVIELLVKHGLDKDHDLVNMVKRAKETFEPFSTKFKLRHEILTYPTNFKSEVSLIEEKINDFYPLLNFKAIVNFDENNLKTVNGLIEYIKLKDEKRKTILWFL